MLEWKDRYSIGITLIDNQHKELFNKVCDLLVAMKSGKGSVEVLKTLDFLEGYVIKHFKDEESIQIKSKYPKFNIQKKQHDGLRNRLLEIKSELTNNGSSLNFLITVQSEISKWLKTHILEEDMDLGRHLKDTNFII